MDNASMKKKIGISYTSTNFQNYWNWFTPEDLAGGIELVELSFEKKNTEDIKQCDGFILTGGVDVHPSLYNGAASYPNQPATYQQDRDEFEKMIFDYSQEKKLPMLGICRGLQLVNVLQGGKLIEDIGVSNAEHKKEKDTDKYHSVRTEENSLLNEITGVVKATVNSAHHQAVDKQALGKNLLVNAKSENDAMIEGLEFNDKTGKGFMLCIQWHPERMKDKNDNPFSQKIKERFLEEIKKTNA
jgi:putative glutamine amidotransferase